MMVESIWHAAIGGDVNASESSHYQCTILSHLTPGTILFSLLQTLFICLERLNATFAISNRILKQLTSNLSVGIGFIITHVYVLLRCIVELLDGEGNSDKPKGCDPTYTFQKEFLLFNEIPNVVLVTVITSCYIAIIVRMVKQRKNLTEPEGLTDLQIKQNKKSALKMHRNVVTLSCIVVITLCAILPRCIYGLYFQSRPDPYARVSSVHEAVNVILLLNPLFDPFVYILRMKEFRDRLKCHCFKRNNRIESSGNQTDPSHH
ncbi:unnamed protein product [Mytilus coruscus]|uniref:G-protein coupled receptors family 1 profile domain-containing protein n=1 Tax=Mytilus coruscus TaxID=42192 RepID=A0A6J8A9E0_MYTCO|nr:unnamed protein product [Mytilus coruscus]